MGQYDKVFNSIIEEMENGRAVWCQPWLGGNGSPSKLITGGNYRGGNVLALWASKVIQGFSSDRWATLKQANGAGLRVKAGSVSTLVYFFSRSPAKKDENGELLKPGFGFVKTYRVFNLDQLEEVVEGALEKFRGSFPHTPIEEIDGLVERLGVTIVQGDAAYYKPSDDTVTMPSKTAFPEVSGYYGTLLHEVAHWTKKPGRVERPQSKNKAEYAHEELVAELASAFMCSQFGIERVAPSAAYLKGWAKACREDSGVLQKAAATAQKVADYILSGGEPVAYTAE